MSPALTLLAMSVPVWLSVTAAFWPGREQEPAEAAGPKCPCGCGYPPGQHNPNRSHR